ncbi:succinyldiaminopimelate transaminase [Aliarcobacter butzleri]|uniref:Succinyldiaminopimelate transaminase n=1 Tax=Aliarcobacter butzleri TaxID=28197 RepID=A0AAW7PPQ1_9BACT|nr:succinyldiaminopimelate transaminase [Aliarcobacter butzleri]MCG3696286.1 succinyldiaminopimelate transaminase [Aliarcobacter butzleri]MCG3698404.1 succinyldiaminopimelate transaminase [Aliarcobacter butzleri]MDN5063113.1 succinyldiaminopimelate transaminase [Aliarcobacter butzleri]MDN5066460.1 succinyldiaminopimelate transaminase [Aliarcobacter butzleri]MDN5079357.1 succinyldiaminopimelate transaminase [Aliarcobacter butzleri]
MNFEKYPFEKLNELLKDIVPNEKYELSVLTIGEPKFETPQFIQDKLKETSSFLRKYPSTIGEPFLRESMINFVKNRFNVSLKMSQIIPTFGTREVLFNFPQFALFDKKNPVIAFTNPFYQIYEGAAIASRAEVIHINLTKENNFKANLSDEELKRCDLVILNFPNNPTSASMDIDELGIWVKKALEFDFILVNDECYSEIYFEENTKPVSLLEASIKVGNSEFKNVLVMNSISKRSSAPGLRSGFIAGDETILKDYLQYRTYIGCASPVPLQEAAAVAWNEQNHVAEFRKIYKRNFEIAQEILGIPTPEATFYIWLEVENDLEFTKNLYKEKNIKVLPGSFLGRGGLGKEYVRIALVENEEKTKESLKRLKDFIDG